MSTIGEVSWRALGFAGPIARGTLAPLDRAALHARAPGAVARPDTLDYRTLLPERGGLFDPRLFGAGTVIDAPPVDRDAPARAHKTTFARVVLAAPIVHPLARLRAADALAALAGTDELDRADALAASPAAAFVLAELPVIPTEYRPLHRDAEDRWQATGINVWYQRVLQRNAALARQLADASAPADAVAAARAGLADAILHLFANDELAAPERDKHGAVVPALGALCDDAARLAAWLAEPPEPARGRHQLAEVVLFARGFRLEVA